MNLPTLHKRGVRQKEIAKELDVSPSTICRELKRNGDKRGIYNAQTAQKLSIERKERYTWNRRFTSSVEKRVRDYLENEQWSPEQIMGYCKVNGIAMVSTERIYQFIREDKKNGGKLYKQLRHKLKHRKRTLINGCKVKIKDRVSIEERDEKINNREEFGHWEADLIEGTSTDLNRKHIDVRNAWQMVDKYTSEKSWEYVSAVDGVEIRSHISPLLPATLEDENPKRFDLIMFLIELSLLDEEVKAEKNIETVVAIAEALQKKVSIPQVKAKLVVIKEVQTEKFWEDVSVSELERVRRDLRELMIFIDGKEKKTFIIDIKDEFTDGETVGKPRLIVSYKQKVLEYLSENSDNPVIQKIKNLEQLTNSDIRQLEKVLWQELGSKDDYEKYTANKIYGNVAIFIRSLVGIERETALQKFSQFIDTNSLNSVQLEYLKSILDYVSVNGDINSQILTNKEPFTEFDWLKVYGQNTVKIRQFVEDIHGVVTTA